MSNLWPRNIALAGLHGRADGRNALADFAVVKISNVEAIKLTSSATPEEARDFINDGRFVMVRLFESFKGRNITAEDFAGRQIPVVKSFMDAGVKYFEIHNEPNLVDEGLTTSWNSGFEFGLWFMQVYKRIRAILPTAQLGFPGLSPGEEFYFGGQLVRVNALSFLKDARQAVLMSDWVGVHCYWQDSKEQESVAGGKGYLEYSRLFPNKLMFITEFSNSSPLITHLDKAVQYIRYYKSIRHVPNLGAAFAYVSSASDKKYAYEAWRFEDGSLSEIPAYVGRFLPMVQGTHVVTASLLNVRRFPWTGTVVPQVVNQVKAGEVVNAIGVYKPLSLSVGWVCISPNGDMWVSGKYLKEIT